MPATVQVHIRCDFPRCTNHIAARTAFPAVAAMIAVQEGWKLYMEDGGTEQAYACPEHGEQVR